MAVTVRGETFRVSFEMLDDRDTLAPSFEGILGFELRQLVTRMMHLLERNGVFSVDGPGEGTPTGG